MPMSGPDFAVSLSSHLASGGLHVCGQRGGNCLFDRLLGSTSHADCSYRSRHDVIITFLSAKSIVAGALIKLSPRDPFLVLLGGFGSQQGLG
jgi:hypothetical protein